MEDIVVLSQGFTCVWSCSEDDVCHNDDDDYQQTRKTD
jgi:hypothetical protein